MMDTPLWLQIWKMKPASIVFFAVFLILITCVILFKDRLSRNRMALDWVRYGILAVSFGFVGLTLKAQPTTTNIIILINSAAEFQFPFGLYLMEPYIFLSFSFIFLTMFIWGRGIFCGWLCPYGAMLELFNKLGRKFSPKGWPEIPAKIHTKLIFVKYIILLIIVGTSFYSFILSEYLTEVEPFRTFVLKLNREWYFVAYFTLISFGSVIFYRAFCRYLCPLGAALALPSFFKAVPHLKLRRHNFCSRCKICAKACTVQAIGQNGTIDQRECFNCLACQVNYFDQSVCPALVKAKHQEESN